MTSNRIDNAIQITAAIVYLMAKNPSALRALDKPIPVLGRGLCLWLPSRLSTLSFDLPALAKGIRL
jgi:hypothetical protein